MRRPETIAFRNKEGKFMERKLNSACLGHLNREVGSEKRQGGGSGG